MANPLLDIQQYGQSIWYDNIQRSLITSGALKRLVDDDGWTGMTSDPAIFEKAITGSTDYNEALQALARRPDMDAKTIYEHLAVFAHQTPIEALEANEHVGAIASEEVDFHVKPHPHMTQKEVSDESCKQVEGVETLGMDSGGMGELYFNHEHSVSALPIVTSRPITTTTQRTHIGTTKIEPEEVTFALQCRDLGDVEGQLKGLMLFDCFDQRPNYHYDLEETMKQLRTRLPDRAFTPNHGGLNTRRAQGFNDPSRAVRTYSS